MHWLAHGITFDQLGGIYHVGTSTNYTVVHEVVTVLEEQIVKTSIPGEDWSLILLLTDLGRTLAFKCVLVHWMEHWCTCQSQVFGVTLVDATKIIYR